MSNQSANNGRLTTVANGAPLVAHIADIIAEIRKRTPFSRILVVAPSSYSAFFLKRSVTDRICECSENGLFNVEFKRIEDVADVLFDATDDRPDLPSMPPLVAFELIHNAITSLDTSGPLSDHAENDSTVAAVQRTLDELALLDVDAEEALKQISSNAEMGVYPQLLEVQRKYSRELGGYVTREQKATIAAQTASQNRRVVTQTLAPDVVVVRAPTGPNAYTDLWESLQNLPSATTVEISVFPSTGTNGSQSQRSTRFYSTLGAADEPRALIRNIISDARNGVKFGEMAVFYPSSDYASRIRDALNTAGIANCGPSTRTLAETSAGKFVSLFLTMLSEGMRRDTFTSWTSSSPVVDPSTKKRVPSVPWEVVSRNAKVSRFSAESDWKNSLDRYARGMYRRAQRAAESMDTDGRTVDPETFGAMSKSASQLEKFVTRLTDNTSSEVGTRWIDWVGWLDTIIDTYLLPDTRETDGFLQIQEALNQVRALDGVTQSQVDFSRFRRTIERILRTYIDASSGWGSSVLVAPLTAGTGTAFKSIHILGMAEGSLPGPGRSDPLLPDNLRRELDPIGSRLLTRSDHLGLDQTIFRMALSCAPSNRLYWNKALMGATNEAYPSPWFVDEVQKAHNQTNVSVKSLMDPQSDYVDSVTPLAEVAASDFSASSEYEFSMRDVAIRSKDSTTRNGLLSDKSFTPLARGNRIALSRRDSEFGDFDGNVGNTAIETLSEWQTSATALESYAQCPYRYFLAHELNVDERIDPEESLELSPLDKGILVHSILEQFLKKHGVDRSDEGLLALREVAQTEFDRFQREEFIGYGTIFDLEKVKLLRDLETWHRTSLDALVGYDGELKTEASFGLGDEKLGQILLNDGFAIQLRGRIDLIAVAPGGDRALVLDFKTGRTSYHEIEKNVTDAGKKLQLPIYSIVANEILGQDADIEAAFWFVFLHGANEFRPRNYVTLEEATEHFRPVISTIIDGIRSGAFPAHPGERNRFNDASSWDNCRYCAYDDVCSSNRLISWDRKKTSPVLEGYVAMSEGQSN